MTDELNNVSDEGRPLFFIRAAQVTKRIGVSRATLWRWVREGLFPKPRKLGRHAVAWVEAEVDEWCANRQAVTGGEQ